VHKTTFEAGLGVRVSMERDAGDFWKDIPAQRLDLLASLWTGE
jgi:hypothetical protein